ncbi:hypothetical protein ACJZ2D_017162 [Fusarium nematophilum]
MVKFSSVDDNGFKRLLGELVRLESHIRNSAASPARSIEEAQIKKPANLSFNNYGPGDQFNAPGGTQNISKGAVGWGYAIYREGRKIAQGKGRLGIAEVFDGEAEGARNALKRACRIDAGAQIHICIDNTSVIAGLLGDAPASSQDAFLEFQEIAQAVAVTVEGGLNHQPETVIAPLKLHIGALVPKKTGHNSDRCRSLGRWPGLWGKAAPGLTRITTQGFRIQNTTQTEAGYM